MVWLAGWNRRKSKVINGTTAGLQTNYQMKLTVHKGSGIDTLTDIYLGVNVRDDFGDIRFTRDDGITLLNYWIESFISGVSATVWIKNDSIPASPSTTIIYLYYDNPSATSVSNISNTLKFAEEWNNIDTSGWEDKECGVVNNKSANIVNGKLRITLSAQTAHPNTGDKSKKLTSLTNVIPSAIEFTLELDSLSSGYQEEHAAITVISDEVHSDIANDKADICTDEFLNFINFGYSLGQYGAPVYGATIIRNGIAEGLFSVVPTSKITKWRVELLSKDKIRIYVDGTLRYSSNTFNFKNISNAYIYQGMWSSSGAIRYVEFDYVRLFNYADPEPTWGAIGSEEIAVAKITAISLVPSQTTCIEPCIVNVDLTWRNDGDIAGTFEPAVVVDGVRTGLGISVTLNPAQTTTQSFKISNLRKGGHTICPDPN